MINDINEENCIKTTSFLNEKFGKNTAEFSVNSVSDENGVNQMISKTIETFGGIDFLINNAGILTPNRIPNITLDEWKRVIDVSLTGTFLCSQKVIEHMKKRKGGRIVNFSSTAGKNVSTIGGCHYTAAKAGILGITRSFAKEFAGDGILVNAVCPGLIHTDMVTKTISQEQMENYAKSFPINRLGTMEEVVNLVLFLCSEKSSYITGASMDVNGGALMV
jgi:NAD(P)-dependent dehydrogenase (short-subunit alcohol dehydrogenase family)